MITKENWNHNINVNEFYSLLRHVILLRVLFITIIYIFQGNWVNGVILIVSSFQGSIILILHQIIYH